MKGAATGTSGAAWFTMLLKGAVVCVVAVWACAMLLPQPIETGTARLMFFGGLNALVLSIALAIATLERSYEAPFWWACACVLIMVAAAATIHSTAASLGSMGVAGVALGLFKHWDDRQEAARRARHDEAMTEWKAFVSNEKLVEAIRMLEYDDPELQCLSNPSHQVSLDDYKRWKNPLDQILEFLLRVATAVDKGQLDTRDALELGEWYFDRVTRNPHVSAYCQREGYGTVLEYARRSGSGA